MLEIFLVQEPILVFLVSGPDLSFGIRIACVGEAEQRMTLSFFGRSVLGCFLGQVH